MSGSLVAGVVVAVFAVALVVLLVVRRPRRAAAVAVADSVGTLDDAVRYRAAGDLPRARAILDALDVARGGGLRRLLRAVAVWESGDAAAARALGGGAVLPGGMTLAVARLQLAAASGRPGDVAGDDALANLARALAARSAVDDAALRRAMTALLFQDPELAAFVASKELGLEAPASTPRAIERYASVARGRDLFAIYGTERISAFLGFWTGAA